MSDIPSLSWTEPLVRSIFDHSSDAMALVDDHGAMIELNRAANALRVDVGRLLNPAGPFRVEVAAFHEEVRSRGTARVELRVPTDRGARQLVLDGRASDPCHVITVHDVTEDRLHEDELRHLRSIESVGLLTASIVHDFNNMLCAVVMSAAALVKELEPNSQAAVLARDILDAGDRATLLVQQVLGLARGRRAGPQRLNPSAAVAEMGGLLRRVVGQQVEVELLLGEGVGPVVADRERFQHVLLNLAANARDAMPQGGKLTIATANVEPGEATAALRGGANARYVVITATDEGVGMPPEVRERIFERFFTTKEPGRGTGLGLAAAHRFVTESGGTITVRSEPGHGTRVALYLPSSVPYASTSMSDDDRA